MRPRLIPVLTLEKGYVVKTTKFRRSVYIGDPINTVKIFNEKEVDELAVVEIILVPPLLSSLSCRDSRGGWVALQFGTRGHCRKTKLARSTCHPFSCPSLHFECIE